MGNGGKSLLALAIDSVFRPQLYQDGIPETVKPDALLNPVKHPYLPVVFSNFSHTEYATLAVFERAVKNYARRNQGAKAVIGTNLKYDFEALFRESAEGVSCRYLDMYIKIRSGRTEPNQRLIKMIVADKDLIPSFV